VNFPLKIIARGASVILALIGCSYVAKAYLWGYTVPPEDLTYITGLVFVTAAYVLMWRDE